MSCSVTLLVTHGGTKWGETLAVTGHSDALGNWKTSVPMIAASFPQWTVTLHGLSAGTLYEYKYVVSSGPRAIASWESLPGSPSGNRSFIAADGLCIDDRSWGFTRPDDPALLAVRSSAASSLVMEPSSTADNGEVRGSSSTTTDSVTSFAGAPSVPGDQNIPSSVKEFDEMRVSESAAADCWTMREVADYLQRELFLVAEDVREARKRLCTSRASSEQAGEHSTATTPQQPQQPLQVMQSASVNEDPDSAISSEEALQIARTLVDDTKLSVQDVRAALVAARSAAAENRLSWNSSVSVEGRPDDTVRTSCLLAFGAAVAFVAAVLVVDPISKYSFV